MLSGAAVDSDAGPAVASLDLYITTTVDVLGLVTTTIDIDGDVTTKIEA